jgi:hypothetical protein
MAVGAVVARILTQYSDKGSKQAQKDIAKLGKKIDAFGKKANKAFLAAGAATAAFAIKVGVDAVRGAAADEKQQTALAMALRNTTGATDEAIAANSKYLDSLELQVAIDNEKLIPALQKLVTATGDLSQAQDLLSLATDVAAASGKDLDQVSTAMSRALGGNMTALTKLGLPLDQNAVKTKNLGKLFGDLAKVSAGQASAAANTFAGRMETLQLAFNQVLDKLGYALLPVIIEFSEYIITDVIPNIDSWVEANEGKLQDSFKGTLLAIKSIIENLLKLIEIVERYKYAILVLAAIPYFAALSGQIMIIVGTAKVLNKVLIGPFLKFLKFSIGGIGKVVTAIRLLGLAFTAMGARAAIAAIPVAFATAGVSVATAAAALAAVGIGAFAIKKGMDAYNDSTKEAAKSTVDLTKQIYGGAAAEKYKAEVAAKEAKDTIERNKRLAKIQAQQIANDKKNAAVAAAIAKGQAALKKFGVKTTEADPIQLEAARLNLVKQGNIAEAERIKAISKNLEKQLEANKALARYNDLLAALADNEISSKDIVILAGKWGMTIEATQSYIQTLMAVADSTISDDEITNLAMAWGVSKDQASRYLDFFNALNDGKLSDAEIAKLQDKWGLTSKEVGIYADLITKASDYVLSDAEITALGTNWGLTTDEVVAYIKKLGQPVTFSGTLIDPATQATLGWKSALAALLAYQAALGNKGVTTPVTPVVPVVPVVPPTTTVTPAGPCGPSRPYYNYYTGECVATESEIKPRGSTSSTTTTTAGDALSAITTATTTKTINAAVAAAIEANESASNIANSMATGLLAQGVSTPNALSTARYTGQAIAAQQKAEQEAAEAALRNQQYAEGMAKRYGGYVGSSTMDNAKGLMAGGMTSTGNTTVNLTVNGSVSTENDLIQSIRTGLLAAQQNGQGLTLQAI